MSSAVCDISIIFTSTTKFATEHNKKAATEYNKILADLLNYEKYFNETGNKFDFPVSEYLKKMKDVLFHNSFRIPKIKVVSKTSNNTYYITIPELLDRFVFVSNNFDIIEITNVINDILKTNDNELQFVHCIKNTSFFMNIFQKLSDINVIKNIKYTENKDKNAIYYAYRIVSDFVNMYIYEVISKISDDKILFENSNIFEKIINNLFNLGYNIDIVKIAEHLVYYKNKFTESNKKSQIQFCDVLLKYIIVDLNLINTGEYINDLQFLQFGTDDLNKFIESISSNYNFGPKIKHNTCLDGTSDICSV